MRHGPVPAPGRALPRAAAGEARPPEGNGCGPGRLGSGGWDQPGRAETGKEGCPAPLRAPGVPEANSRVVWQLFGADLPPGLSQLCRVVCSGRRIFLLAALFEWNGG